MKATNKKNKKQSMLIYVDIDGTICETDNSDYVNSQPIQKNINKINKLFDEGHTIIYWMARGQSTGLNWAELTLKQLKEWGCKFHNVSIREKPMYDMLIDDKAKRIEEV